jgi:hypothetical protein
MHQQLISQDRVAAGQFSFRIASEASGDTSELYLGGANPSQYSGSLEWNSVASQSYWTLKGDVKVGSDTAIGGTYMIVDTGTTVIVVPTNYAKTIWSQVEGASVYGSGYYTYPCASPPKISFNFGGKDWTVGPDSLNIGRVSEGSPRCVGSIVGQDVGMHNVVILGVSWPRSVAYRG